MAFMLFLCQTEVVWTLENSSTNTFVSSGKAFITSIVEGTRRLFEGGLDEHFFLISSVR